MTSQPVSQQQLHSDTSENDKTLHVEESALANTSQDAETSDTANINAQQSAEEEEEEEEEFFDSLTTTIGIPPLTQQQQHHQQQRGEDQPHDEQEEEEEEEEGSTEWEFFYDPLPLTSSSFAPSTTEDLMGKLGDPNNRKLSFHYTTSTRDDPTVSTYSSSSTSTAMVNPLSSASSSTIGSSLTPMATSGTTSGSKMPRRRSTCSSLSDAPVPMNSPVQHDDRKPNLAWWQPEDHDSLVERPRRVRRRFSTGGSGVAAPSLTASRKSFSSSPSVNCDKSGTAVASSGESGYHVSSPPSTDNEFKTFKAAFWRLGIMNFNRRGSLSGDDDNNNGVEPETRCDEPREARPTSPTKSIHRRLSLIGSKEGTDQNAASSTLETSLQKRELKASGDQKAASSTLETSLQKRELKASGVQMPLRRQASQEDCGEWNESNRDGEVTKTHKCIEECDTMYDFMGTTNDVTQVVGGSTDLINSDHLNVVSSNDDCYNGYYDDDISSLGSNSSHGSTSSTQNIPSQQRWRWRLPWFGGAMKEHTSSSLHFAEPAVETEEKNQAAVTEDTRLREVGDEVFNQVNDISMRGLSLPIDDRTDDSKETEDPEDPELSSKALFQPKRRRRRRRASMSDAQSSSSAAMNPINISIDPSATVPMKLRRENLDQLDEASGISAGGETSPPTVHSNLSAGESNNSSSPSVDRSNNMSSTSSLVGFTKTRLAKRRGSTGTSAQISLLTPQKEPLLLRSCFKGANGLIVGGNKQKREGVRINENRNLYYDRTIPVITIKECQDRWYTRMQCKQMKAISTGFFIQRAARALGLAFRACCEGSKLTHGQIDGIRKCIEQDECMGMEHILVESICADMRQRRKKLVGMVVFSGQPKTKDDNREDLSADTNMEIMRRKYNDLSKPARLFALAVGHAQQPPQSVERTTAMVS